MLYCQDKHVSEGQTGYQAICTSAKTVLLPCMACCPRTCHSRSLWPAAVLVLLWCCSARTTLPHQQRWISPARSRARKTSSLSRYMLTDAVGLFTCPHHHAAHESLLASGYLMLLRALPAAVAGSSSKQQRRIQIVQSLGAEQLLRQAETASSSLDIISKTLLGFTWA